MGVVAFMSLASRVVALQALIGSGCIAAFWIVDAASARSALLAMTASLLPCGYFAWVQSRTFDATRLIMHGVMKSILTVVLMAVGIVVFEVEPAGFFVTFAVMQLSYLARQPAGKKK